MTDKSAFQSRDAGALLAASAAEANTGVSHADFVAGVNAGMMGFKCLRGETSSLIIGPGRLAFHLCVMLYAIGPLVVMPIVAWQNHNPWLLFGIVASYVGSFGTAIIGNERPRYSAAGILAFVCLCTWIFLGGYNYFTVFVTCALCGSVLFLIADSAEAHYALRSIVVDAEYFQRLLDQSAIMIVRRESQHAGR